MKKFLSVILALVLVLSLGTVAFAVDGDATTAFTDMSKVTITKNYTINGGTSPAETFMFTIEKVGVEDAGVGITADNMPVPTIPADTVSFAALSASSSATFDVTLPTYTGVGIYTYKIREVAGATAGVTYNTDDLYLKVTVIQDASGLIRIAAVHLATEDGDKKSEVTNSYAAGSLTVNKTVTGNLGDLNKYFEVTVTLTGETGKTYAESFAVSGGSDGAQNPTTIKINTPTVFKLKSGDTISIANIPAGVTYKVEEKDYSRDGYADPDYTDKTGTIAANTESAAKIVNNKDGEVDTGISLDSMPYVVLLTVAVLGVAVVLTKKRMAE